MPLFAIPSNTISIDSLPPVVLKGLDSAFNAASGMVLPVSLPQPVNFYVMNKGVSLVPASGVIYGFPMYARADQNGGGNSNGGSGEYSKFVTTVYTNSGGTLAVEASNSIAADGTGIWQSVTTPVTVGAAAVKNNLTGGATLNPGWTTIEVPFLAYAMRAVFTAGADACTVRLAYGRVV